jgi:hypothetical protein
MPIGKNAINRVANNGYSNVKSTAPDMENSVVAEVKAAPKKAPAKNPVPKAATSKSGVSASKGNPVPKAAILAGMKPVIKETKAKKSAQKPKIIPLEEPKTEAKTEAKIEEKPIIESVPEKEEIEAEKATETPKKSMESEPELAPIKTLEKVSERAGVGYTNLGGSLPVYLL